MSVRSSGAVEFAMTHRVGAGGQREVCHRPDPVRAMVTRMQQWLAEPETCKSCQALPSVSIRAGLALCSRCRQEAALRLGWSLDTAGLAPRDVRADDGGAGPQLRGHAIVFNQRSVNLGGFVEIIRPAAADRMESEKPDLLALWNHDSSLPLGRSTAGTLRYRKVTRGVSVEIDPPKWAGAQVESVDRRDVKGMSFGFIAISDDWHLEDRIVVREVLDMDVFEVSPVSFPAYPQTDIKAINAQERAKWNQRAVDARLRAAR
jgi:HK97 family phage prohead protease